MCLAKRTQKAIYIYKSEFPTILKLRVFRSLPTFHFAESILSMKHLQKWNKTREIRISHRCDTPKDGVSQCPQFSHFMKVIILLSEILKVF